MARLRACGFEISGNLSGRLRTFEGRKRRLVRQAGRRERRRRDLYRRLGKHGPGERARRTHRGLPALSSERKIDGEDRQANLIYALSSSSPRAGSYGFGYRIRKFSSLPTSCESAPSGKGNSRDVYGRGRGGGSSFKKSLCGGAW